MSSPTPVTVRIAMLDGNTVVVADVTSGTIETEGDLVLEQKGGFGALFARGTWEYIVQVGS